MFRKKLQPAPQPSEKLLKIILLQRLTNKDGVHFVFFEEKGRKMFFTTVKYNVTYKDKNEYIKEALENLREQFQEYKENVKVNGFKPEELEQIYYV